MRPEVAPGSLWFSGHGYVRRPRGNLTSMKDEAEITLYEDGPYLVRGSFKLADAKGNEIDPGRKTIALCRCGRSKIKPFCDGTHKVTKWRASGETEARRPSQG